MRPAAKNTVCKFQSTLSVRRATLTCKHVCMACCISIHALRKESDVAIDIETTGLGNFNPRSP